MNDAEQTAPNRLLLRLRWSVLAALCLAVAATALWAKPAAAQTPITTRNPCLASENLTQQTGTSVRGIANQPVISRNGARLAFWSTNDITPSDSAGGNPDGNIEIFVKELAGARSVTQLTHSMGSILGGFNLEPSINAAGTHIAFYSDRDLVGRNADGNFEIFLARRTSSRWIITQVTDTQGSANLFPSINAVNGGVVQIAFASDDKDLGGVDANPFRNFEIFLATIRNGSVQIQQVTNSPAGTTNDQPVINGAGDRIVYTAGMGQVSQIYVWDARRGASTQLTSSGTNTQPAINADGTHISYIGTNNQGRTRVVLHTLSADGTESRSEPIAGPAANTIFRSPNLSDDGTRVVYVTDVGAGSNRQVNVVLYDVSTRLPVVISQLGDGIGEQPAISGDGTRISFVGTRSVGGNTDVVGSDIYVNECPLADLSLEFVQPPPATVLAGTNLTLRLRVTNHGPSVARDAVIEVDQTNVAPLPANVTRVLPDQCRSAPDGNTLCDLGDLNAGQSVTRDFVFELASNAQLANIEYAYAVRANAVDQNEADNSTGIRRTRVTEEAALKITMTAEPERIVAGLSSDVLTYDLMVSNGGPSQARSTVLTDTLPTGARLLTTTLVSGGGSGVTCPATANDARVTCRLGNLLAGASAHVRVQVNALPSAPETFVNVAEVRSLTGELDTSDNVVQVTTAVSRSADMQISISAWPTDTVHAGTELTYTVVVTNAGFAETVGVKVIDLLPNHVTFVRDATSAGGTCSGDVSGQTVTCTVPGTMEPGDTRTLSYVTLLSPIAPAGEISNTARVMSDRVDPNPDNNISDPEVTNVVTLLADLFVNKTVNNAQPNVRERITYTVSVRNFGPSQAYSVTVMDKLPSNLQYVEHIAQVGTSYDELTGRWDVGTIPVDPGNSTRTLTIVAFPKDEAGGQNVVNTAVVSDTGQPDLEPPLGHPSQDSAAITPQSADLAVSKTGPEPLIAGQNITYTIIVTNAGPTAAQDVVVTDTLPAGVGLVSVSGACTEAAGQVTCDVGTMQLNDSVTYSVVVTRGLTGLITNTVSVASSTPDNNADNNTFVLTGTILPDVPAFLTFTQQPPAAVEAGANFSLAVALHDRFGNLVYVGEGSDDTIELTAYRDASCQTAINDVPLGGNQGAADEGIALFGSLVYTRAETIYLGAVDITSGREGVQTACSDAVAVGAAQTAQIVFTTAPMTVIAGEMSPPITVQRQDQFGNPNSSDPDLTLNLTTTAVASGAFLTDTSPQPITQVTIEQDSSIASFIYTDTVQGVYTLTVGNGGLIEAMQTIRITADTAKQLVILAPPPPISAGERSEVVTVERRDQFGNANFTDDEVTLDLVSSSGTYTFYDSADEPVDSLTIGAGSASADFRYADTLAATHTLTVSDRADSLTSAQVDVEVVPGPSYRLRLTTEPYTITAGSSTGVITLVREDAFGNLNRSDPDLTVALTTASTSDAARFSLTPMDSTPITSVVIAQGDFAADFAYYDEWAGTHVLTVADAPGELLPDAQPVRVEPGDASQLAVLTAGQVVTAGMPSNVITVQRQDEFGNADPNAGTTVVSLHSPSNTGVFLEAASDTAIEQVIITETQASFRYSDTAAGSPVLTLEPEGTLAGATYAITITADTATQLVFTTAPPTSTAGLRVGPFTLERRDQYGNPNSTDPALTVHLGGGSEEARFYGSPPGMDLKSIDIDNGSATGEFYYRNTQAGSHVITASAAIGSIAPVTTVIEVEPGAPDKLVFLGDSQTITAGVTSEVFVVELQDIHDNPVTPPTPITATLSSLPAGPSEFLDAPGGSAKDTLTFDGNSQDTFYYTAQRAGQHALMAHVASFLPEKDGKQNVLVVAAATDRIVFVTDPHQFTAGQRSPLITVERRDQFGNANRSDPNLTLNLTTTAVASGAFLTDTLPQPITQVVIEQDSSRASFYYTDTVRATPTITVSDANNVLASISQTHTVVGGPAARLVLNGPAATTAGTPEAITITALDALGNRADSFDGEHSLSFGGVEPTHNGWRSSVTNMDGAPIDLGQQVDLLFVEGLATASGGQNMLTIYQAGAQTITATVDELAGLDVAAVGADALTIQVDPAAQAVVRAETADGAVVGSRTLTAGATVDIYAVSRDAYWNETGTVDAVWTLARTGAVQPGDLAPTTGVSTTFSARGVGTAVITPTFGSLTPTGTGVLTVVADEAATVRVETAGDGSGVLVPPQTLIPGQAVTAYAVARDAYGNFAASPEVTWSMSEATGGVSSANLAPMQGISTTFTANQVGSGRIMAAVDDLASIASGVITVTAGPPVRLALTAGATTVDAGESLAVTFRAYDAAGNVATSYDGERTLVFSGAAPSLRPVITPTVTDQTGATVDFGQPVTLHFDQGVAAPTDEPDTQRITIYLAGAHTISATDGVLTTDPAGNLSVTVEGLGVERLALETPTPDYTAGVAVPLTIKAEDAYGNVDETYDGNEVLRFESVPSATAPDGTRSFVWSDDDPPREIYLGESGRRIDFVDGIAQATATANGALTLFRSGEFAISAAQNNGQHPSGPLGTITVTVAPSLDQVPVLSLVSPQVNGELFTGPGNRIEIRDVYSNVVTDFNAALYPVTLTVDAPLDGVISLGGGDNVLDADEFSNGAVQLDQLGLRYSGVAGTGNFVASLANPSGGTSSHAAAVTIHPAAPVMLQILGATGADAPTSEITVTAGAAVSLTLRALDFAGNLATNYNATPALFFSGAPALADMTPPDPAVIDTAGEAVRLGEGTTLQFINGVAQVTNDGWNGTLRIYQAGTYAISAQGGEMDTPSSDQLAVHVVPGPVASYEVNFTSPQTLGQPFVEMNTVRALDAHGNLITHYDGEAEPVRIVPLSPLTGTVSGLSGPEGDIIDPGAWIGGEAAVDGLIYDNGADIAETGALRAERAAGSPPQPFGDSLLIDFEAVPPPP